MRNSIHFSFALKVLVLTSMFLAKTALAEYPERRVQLFYPLTARTPTYEVSKLIADAMSKELGANIVITAKPGASGADALMAAIREPADGYTLIDAYVAPLIISPLFGKVPYSCADFTPLYSGTSTPIAIVSRANEKRWTDYPSFIKFLRANPGRTRYTAGAELSMPHLIIATMLKTINAVSRHITFTDLHEGAAELRDGNLDWMMMNPGLYQDAKKGVRVIAVLSDLPEAAKLYGDAKLTADFGINIGLTGMASKPWDWWVVKKGTPTAVVEKLRSAMTKALARPEVKSELVKRGYLPLGFGPEQFQETCSRVATELKNAMGAIDWEKTEIGKLK